MMPETGGRARTSLGLGNRRLSLTLPPTRMAWRSADLRSGAVLRSSPLLPGRRPALRGQGRAGGGIVFRWNGAPSAVSASWSRICSSRDGARRSKPYRHLQVWVTNLIGSVNYSAPDKCPVLHKHLVSVSICVHPWLSDDFALHGNLRLRPPPPDGRICPLICQMELRPEHFPHCRHGPQSARVCARRHPQRTE